MVYVFLDACPDEEMQKTNKTFQALVSLMGLEVGARVRASEREQVEGVGGGPGGGGGESAG